MLIVKLVFAIVIFKFVVKITFTSLHFSLQKLLYRAAIEENPITYTASRDEIRLSAEILKIMFNITINLPEPDSTDTMEHCERIVFIVRSILVHLNPLPEQSENLPNHAINIVSNMPSSCLKYLLWTMPSSVCKSLAQDFDSRTPSKRFRFQFEVIHAITYT